MLISYKFLFMKIRNTTVSNYNYNIFDTCYNLTDYNDISSFKKYSIIFGLKHGIILKSKRKTKEKIKDLSFILNFFGLSEDEIYNRKLLRFINKSFDGSSFYNQFVNLEYKNIKDDVFNQIYLFLNFLKKNIFNFSGITISKIILKNKSKHFKILKPEFEKLYSSFLLQDGQYEKTIKFISSLKKNSYTNKVWFDLRLTAGQCFGELGQYKKATAIFEKNFDKLKKNKNIYYLKAGNELALLYLKEGNFKKSQQLLSKLLIYSKKTFNESIERFEIQNALAKFYNEVGDFENSMIIFRELENEIKIKLGEHSAFYMQVLGNLSSILANTGNFKQAIDLKRKVLKLQTRAFGEFHLISITSRQDLITSYTNVNKIKQAKNLYDKNDKVVQLKDFVKEVNIRHLLNKVEMLYYRKKYFELKELLNELNIFDLLKNRFNQFYVLTICRFLIISLININNLKECLSFINKILPKIVSLYSHSHHLFNQTVFNKIYCLVELGKFKEGLEYINQILTNYKISEKNNSLFFMGLIEQRSIIFEKLLLFKNSCKDLEKYITLHEKKNGLDKNYYFYVNDLAQNYKLAGLHKKAIEYFQIEFNYLRNNLSPDDDEVKETLSNLDQYLFDQKLHSKAIEYLRTQIKKLKDKDIQLSMSYRVRSIDHLEEIADFKNILKELKIVINYCISNMGVEHQATLTNNYKYCYYLFKLNQFNSCKNYLLKQYKIYLQYYVKDELNLKGPFLQILGKVYSELNLNKKALTYFNECIKHEENLYQSNKNPNGLISVYKDCIKYLKKDNLDFVNEVKTKLEQIQSS